MTSDDEYRTPEAQRLKFRDTLRKRINRNSHTHNESELRLIRYLGRHAHATEAQQLLFMNDTIVELLARVFKHLPNIHDIDIFTGQSYVGGARLSRTFEGFSALELDYSGRNTIKSFCTALNEAPVRIHKLAFITDTMLCLNYYDDDCCDLVYSSSAEMHRERFYFGSIWEADPVVHHLPSTLDHWLSCTLLSNLCEFRLYLNSNYRHLTGGGDKYGMGIEGDFYPGLNRVFRHARNLERLEFGLNWNSYRSLPDFELASGLDVGTAFSNAYPTRLKHIELRQCEPKSLGNVLKLFRMCADLLEVVYVEDSFRHYDSWREILQQLKKYQFPSLKCFDLYDQYLSGFYDAGPYLQGLEACDPMTAADEEG